MKELTAACEQVGCEDVRTYLNTGNILLSSHLTDTKEVGSLIEKTIQNTFGLDIATLVLTREKLTAIVQTIPHDWSNDADTMKADAMFLWEQVDSPDIIGQLPRTEGIDTIIYTP